MKNIDRFIINAYPVIGILAVGMSASLSWSPSWVIRAVGYACMLLMVYLTGRMLDDSVRHRRAAQKLLAEARTTRLEIIERITAQQARNNGFLERARRGGFQ